MNNGFNQHLAKSPLGLKIYAATTVIFTAIFVFLLMQGSYGKQETAKGLIRNEAFYRVAASKVGNVMDLYVKEGDKVDKGMPLFRVALPWQDVKDRQNGKSMLGETINRLLETQQDIKTEEQHQQQEWETLIKQKEIYFSQFDKKIKKIDEVKKDYQQKSKLYNKQLDELNHLLKNKSVNKAEVENLKQIIIDNNLALKKTDVDYQNLLQSQAEQEINYLRMERELLKNKSELERRKREVINELNKIQMEQEYIVSSPVTGTVHDVGILKGDFVDGKSPAIIVKEEGKEKPIVILYLSASQIGLIDRRENVFLRVDTFPYENYGMLSAQIINVANTPTHVSLDEKESLFRVKLRINENDKHNKIPIAWLNDGMSVTTSLRQPKQSLLEWLFLPVKKAFKRNPDFVE
ncbi:HlyD family efflux transporter periplasmic adaptor subunit [Erwinia phyllosphaerae]|uniref:HlyD family efflux transporter periplasmic adaptor subunit n=1 Tax=Erwinia phyllosphaerae TaxID=2853256 RepID=UPI001FEDD24A|nr:HlyD family efflux transporter periplasmic adaptor subunit [Erwinia phyllosphaerae]MBV4366489.1 HlyD family secretion protein [Erwinia phyllosphaerae]